MKHKDPAAVALGRKGGQAKVTKGPMAGKSEAERKAWSANMAAARKTNKTRKEKIVN